MDLCRRGARTACLLWIAVTPAFVLIDYARFPEVASYFLPIRTLYVAINALLLALLASRLGQTRPREIALVSTAVGGILIFALMSYTGGHASPYVNGMGLLILGTALIMPWSPAWSMLTSLVLVASYGGYALVADPIGDGRMFANNVIGFTATGLIGVVSTIARERLRWREFKNRFAFEQTYAEKCDNEAQLKLEIDANRRLIEALEQANRIRSEFVSTMSHELRTPLNVMMGFADMARDPTFDPAERDDLLERIRRAAARLLEIVDGTLEIGKLEAGRTQIDTQPVEIASLWSDLGRGCADLVPRPGVTLHWEDQLPDGDLHTDPRKLLIIVRNLLGNALKFTDHGHVHVRLVGDSNEITLVVADTGIGIEPQDHELVFEMFRQLDSSETRRFEGCGLGLYIVRQFAQRLGGSVRLASEPGKGSSFSVTLPREPASPTGEGPGHSEAAGRRAA